ncbi:MAG: ATP-dependent sacrificial sulfur transferase LarE [Bacteroidales bacterium]|nr:ATP-dependent sacrificial sulfur transferase LarE [Bacteroidales bacterium]
MVIHDKKYQELQHKLKQTGSLVVAFSGGVDSTFLLAAGKEALGNNILAITVSTPYVAGWEEEESREIAKNLGVEQIILEYPLFENIKNNPPQRCYLCKKQIFSAILEEAERRGYSYVADGTNVDDFQDIRPGIRALRELNVRSPLAEANLGKNDIRRFSKDMGLPTWDKPAYACLLSRLPFNTPIRQEVLDRIEEAEQLIRNAGFPAARVRTHEHIARIEIPPDEIQKFIQISSEKELPRKIKSLGYNYVTLDLEGYKMGSFNEPEN